MLRLWAQNQHFQEFKALTLKHKILQPRPCYGKKITITFGRHTNWSHIYHELFIHSPDDNTVHGLGGSVGYI